MGVQLHNTTRMMQFQCNADQSQQPRKLGDAKLRWRRQRRIASASMRRILDVDIDVDIDTDSLTYCLIVLLSCCLVDFDTDTDFVTLRLCDSTSLLVVLLSR